MGVMEDFLRLLGLTAHDDPPLYGDTSRPTMGAPRALAMALAADPVEPATVPAVGRRRLEQTLRRLPDRYRDRLGPAALRQVTRAAAGERWDKAVDHLVTALCLCDAPITAAERQELRAVLRALDRPTDRVDALPRR
ncbi:MULTISPECIES: hypothetical protein [Actinomadura]|uniref:Uncharacterized protein n=1 Tax=Actinomadura miaoliensis TaxID=430685 RepID=A0ABP7WNX7_9ACTN